MTRCWVMAIWSFSCSGRRTDTGYRKPNCDIIFCPMLLCSALDKWTDNNSDSYLRAVYRWCGDVMYRW